MEKFIDLHIHSYYSDGLLSPKEIVDYALKRNLAAIAIADHDTTLGIPETVEEGKKGEIEIVPAVELSAEMVPYSHHPESNQRIENVFSTGFKLDNTTGGKEAHILGYYINCENEELQKILTFFRQKRKERAQQIYEKLQNLGIKLDPTILSADSAERERSFGRLHFARALVKEGYVSNISQAFQLYLNYRQPAYVEKTRLKPEEAIKLILRAGGIPVLAHPYSNSDETILQTFASYGLEGIEVWHGKHSPGFTQKLISLAKKLGLLMTGGSDYHGETNEQTPYIGNVKVPYSVLEELKQLKNAPVNNCPSTSSGW